VGKRKTSKTSKRDKIESIQDLADSVQAKLDQHSSKDAVVESRERKDSEYEKEITALNDLIEKNLEISLCPHCYSMTHTINGKCGKCQKEKK